MFKSLAFLSVLVVALWCNIPSTQAQGEQLGTAVITPNQLPAIVTIARFLPDFVEPAAAAETDTAPPTAARPDKNAGLSSLALAAALVFIGFLLGLLAPYAYRSFIGAREEEEIFPDTVHPKPPELKTVESAKTVPPITSASEQAKPESPTDDMETLAVHGQSISDISRNYVVDEIDSVVEEAKIFVALGRAHRAIDLLVDYIDTNRDTSAECWVYLMDLYRNLDNKAEFDVLAVRFKHAFNVMEPQWDSELVDLTIPVSLDEFPNIENKLVALWGTSECVNMLTELISDNREGTRTGFSLDVFNEILMLIAVAEMRESMPGIKQKKSKRAS